MSERLAFLKTTELLGAVPDPLVEIIDGRLEEVRLAPGEVLFEEGDDGDA